MLSLNRGSARRWRGLGILLMALVGLALLLSVREHPIRVSPIPEWPMVALVALFCVAAGVVWFAGIRLSDTTDVLSTRLGLGEALTGLLLLAVATNLPEIAIVASAALGGDLGIAIGNILGGIALQTVVLVVLDVWGLGPRVGLTYRAASLVLVLEGVLVVVVLVIAIMGSRLPGSLIFFRLAPGDVLIVAMWGVGVWLLGKARLGLPWHESAGGPADAQEAPMGTAELQRDAMARQAGVSTRRAVCLFAVAALATLAAGVILEITGDSIADRVGLSGVFFGATLLAAATSLPELSTGLGSVRLGDYQLAVSDIFGGNAFLPVLFALATLLSGRSVLPLAQDSDIYLAALGILLTGIYMTGLIFRPRRQIFGMGPDSLVVLLLYALGVVGLIALGATGAAQP